MQGLDYAYTLQGWIKSMNGQDLNPLREMGRDGESGSGLHSGFSRDVLAYSVGYFIGDYQPINNSNLIRTYSHFGVNGLRGKSVFNGNIAYTTVANKGLGDGPTINAYLHSYEQGGRLSGRTLKVIPGGSSSWTDNTGNTGKYNESLAFDLNGNIVSYIRAGDLSTDAFKMDELLYDYLYRTNKLTRVRDNYLNTAAYANDIETQGTDNYSYDKIGNLVKDVQEGITGIFWNVYGKIREIRKGTTVIKYRYDAAGNRVYKEEVGPGVNTATWYVRDAQGNTLATYEGVTTPTIKESYIYGSSRLGSYSWNIGVGTPARTYEISNYLGNVMATIGDGQIPKMNGSLIEYYDADIKTATDYYSYGMVMPGRTFNSGTYRYGFNGQEMSNEIKGVGNSYTAKFWEYDPRLGRRWNLDPRPVTGVSQYSTFNNNPILLTDLLGDSSVFDYKGNKLYYDKNDKDLRVFMKGKNNSLELIGTLGGNINITTILNERLKLTRTQMLTSGGGSFLRWIGSVWQGSRYDLKNNENTLWGVAWAYDKSSQAAHTSFTASYNGLNLKFRHAADVGNFHAGYAGGYAGVSISTQKFWAGAGEKGKNAYYGYMGGNVQEERENLWGNNIFGAPWGDRKPDYFWNTLGMSMADYDKKINASMEIKPFTLPQLEKVSSDNLRLVPKSIILPKSN